MGNLKEWGLSTSEVGKSCGVNKGKTFKVYLAKVLPLVKFAKPKAKAVAISKTCYVNSNTCKPSVSTKVRTRNYLELPVSKNSTKMKTIKHGTKLRIDVQNKNVDRMYVVSKAEKVIK